MFIFSGHGDDGKIYAHDSDVLLQQHIFDPWLPKNAPHLATIPKLFFIDACRGNAADLGVPIISDSSCPSGAVAKGGRAPSFGNYLLAYSTMPSMKSFEQPKTGGYWLQHVTRELQDESNIDLSIGDVLTKVNDKLLDEMERDNCEHIQQPVLESTLRQNVYLLKEARSAG